MMMIIIAAAVTVAAAVAPAVVAAMAFVVFYSFFFARTAMYDHTINSSRDPVIVFVSAFVGVFVFRFVVVWSAQERKGGRGLSPSQLALDN